MLTLIESTSNHERAIEREVYLLNIGEQTTVKDTIINHLDCSRQWKATKIDDGRYSVSLTFAGYAHQMYLVYFAGEWLGSYRSADAAFHASMSHKFEREANI